MSQDKRVLLAAELLSEVPDLPPIERCQVEDLVTRAIASGIVLGVNEALDCMEAAFAGFDKMRLTGDGVGKFAKALRRAIERALAGEADAPKEVPRG